MSRFAARTFSLCLVLLVGVLLPACVPADDVQWSTDIEGSLKRAAASGQPVLMEFTASWCVYCKRMEKTTFADPAVASRITEHFVPVRVDADKHKDLVADLSIKGLPAILIVSPDLQIIERISGFQTPEALIGKLDRVAATVKPAGPAPAAAPTTIVSSPNPRHAPAANQIPPVQRRELEFEPITSDSATARPQPATIRPVSQPVTAELNPVRSQKPSLERVPATAAGTAESDRFLNTMAPSMETNTTSGFTSQAAPAFRGSCLVSAAEDREIVPGSQKFQTTYRGQVLHFRSLEHKERFLAQPANYWPMLDGQCPITLLNDEQKVVGELQFAAVFRKRIWLFASKESMQEFIEDPAEVVEEIAEQFPTP